MNDHDPQAALALSLATGYAVGFVAYMKGRGIESVADTNFQPALELTIYNAIRRAQEPAR